MRPNASSASLGDQKWWDVFQDPQLQQLIRTALQQNYDVRIAATRVLEAQAQVGITRAGQFPTVNGGQRHEPICEIRRRADSFIRVTSARVTRPLPGTSTSGASIAAQRKRPARNCSQASGRARR